MTRPPTDALGFVRELADLTPTAIHDGFIVCGLCQGEGLLRPMHEPDCLWLRAKRFLSFNELCAAARDRAAAMPDYPDEEDN